MKKHKATTQQKGNKKSLRSHKRPGLIKAGPIFYFVAQDDKMAPIIIKNDRVMIDSRIKDFDEFCQGVYLIQNGPPGSWEIVRPVPYTKEGRIDQIVGYRQENVPGMRLKNPATIKIIGRALSIHRDIAPIFHMV